MKKIETVDIDTSKYDLLPTGKCHISFSELSTWNRCKWQHKLRYVDKIDIPSPKPLADFGTAVHLSNENFIKTGVVDPKISEKSIRDFWEKEGHEDVDDFVSASNDILAEIKNAYDIHFPGWKSLDAEQKLFYDIDTYEKKKHLFKGFIDTIIEAPGPRKKQLTWIIDVKTCFWGWTRQKKQDPDVIRQLVLYKHFYHKKNPHINFNDIRCAFLLLKRQAKKGSHCEFMPVSIGEKTVNKHLTVVNNMLHCLNKEIYFKDRYSCEYCLYRDTDWCV
jgi:hypothetical protein